MNECASRTTNTCNMRSQNCVNLPGSFSCMLKSTDCHLCVDEADCVNGACVCPLGYGGSGLGSSLFRF